jgi:sortase A
VNRKTRVSLGFLLFLCVLAPAAAEPPDKWTSGRIEISRLGVSGEIQEGDGEATLKSWVGHIPGTALPGSRGNVALAAHRYSYFRGLRNVRCGDRITLTTPDGEFGYEVDSIRVVEISQVEVLEPTEKPVLTLVTCFPFDYVGQAPQRLIVRAHQIETPAVQVAVSSGSEVPPSPGGQK